jgi:hypothetical protein
VKNLLPPIIVLTACYLLFFSYVYSSYGDLPARVASHFDAAGHPNGWMSRDGVVDFTLGLGILMPAFVLATMAGAGWLPSHLVNLPNREYWLAPERRPAVRRVLLCFGLWFCCLNVLFVTGLHYLIVGANGPGTSPQLNGVGLAAVAGGFLGAILIWSGFLLRYFMRQGPAT